MVLLKCVVKKLKMMKRKKMNKVDLIKISKSIVRCKNITRAFVRCARQLAKENGVSYKMLDKLNYLIIDEAKRVGRLSEVPEFYSNNWTDWAMEQSVCPICGEMYRWKYLYEDWYVTKRINQINFDEDYLIKRSLEIERGCCESDILKNEIF